MDKRLSRDLDNYITGHYGEDQFKPDAKRPTTKDILSLLYMTKNSLNNGRIVDAIEALKAAIEKVKGLDTEVDE